MELTTTERKFASATQRVWPPLFFGMTCHRTHRNEVIDFKQSPFLKQIFMDSAKDLVVMKSTQCGVSEYLLCRAISLALAGKNVFYVFPTDHLIGRFVRERFDKTIEYTKRYYFEAQQGPTKGRSGRFGDSVTMKQFGSGTIVFVGSNSPSSFTEFVADTVIVDELDKCNAENTVMAIERAANSPDRSQIKVSNPTISGFGIDAEYQNSCQYEWHVKCEHCNEWNHPYFFDHVVREVASGVWAFKDEDFDYGLERDVFTICKCGKPFDARADGKWIAKYPTRKLSGYHIGKEFSTRTTLREIADRFDAGSKDPVVMQRFWNADLGLSFTPVGSKITIGDLVRCIEDYQPGPGSGGAKLIGIDVGAVFNVIIGRLDYGRNRLFLEYIGEIPTVKELFEVMARHKVRAGVIDALPERRLSKGICAKHKGMFSCWYGNVKAERLTAQDITVDRTAALDQARDSITAQYLAFPRNARTIPRFFDQLMSSVRVYDQEAYGGEGMWDWVHGTEQDHYFHALAYLMVARNVAMKMIRNVPLREDDLSAILTTGGDNGREHS